MDRRADTFRHWQRTATAQCLRKEIISCFMASTGRPFLIASVALAVIPGLVMLYVLAAPCKASARWFALDPGHRFGGLVHVVGRPSACR